MFTYKAAEIQTHFLFADACRKLPHKTHTHTYTHFVNLNRVSETDVAFAHKTIQEPEQWFLFIVSDKKSAAQVSLVFVKQKDYSYILNQQALQTQQITHIARYSWNLCRNDSSIFLWCMCWLIKQKINYRTLIILLWLIKGATPAHFQGQT